MAVRELPAGETALAYDALIELRPDAGPLDAFVRRVDEVQRPEGYRVVASFDDDDDGRSAAAAAGFRVGHSLAWGRYLYIDDLVTREAHRHRGHAQALLDWAAAEARRLGCDQLHLDSGTHRHPAHRLYLAAGLDITGFHFCRSV